MLFIFYIITNLHLAVDIFLTGFYISSDDCLQSNYVKLSLGLINHDAMKAYVKI
jgi:hypothetical protein